MFSLVVVVTAMLCLPMAVRLENNNFINDHKTSVLCQKSLKPLGSMF